MGSNNNQKRWEMLLELVEMLHNGTVDLDELATEIKNKKTETSPARNSKFHNDAEKDGSRSQTNTGREDSVACNARKTKRQSTNHPIHIQGNFNPTHYEEGETSKSGSLKNKSINSRKSSFQIRDSVPQKVKKHILDSGGSLESAVLVIEKKLYQSDVDTGLGRLSMPHSQVNTEYLLNPSEVKRLNDGNVIPVPLTFFEGDNEECEMINLKNWNSNSQYALITGWNNICRRNKLEKGTDIQLWSFRRDLNLRFVLVKKKPDEEISYNLVKRHD